jgi:cysteine desulfurase
VDTNKSRIVTTKIEHKAVLDSYKNLANFGFKSDYIETDSFGAAIPKLLSEYITNDTSLVSIMHTNNELGTINNISEISSMIGSDQYFFSDCVQAFGKTNIDVNKLKVDALSASAHKIYGPKGIGIAYVKSGTPLSPILFGGSQERNRRGGTENVPYIVGFAEAVKLAQENMIFNSDAVLALKKYFIDSISSVFGNKIDINSGADTSPYILSITFNSAYFKNDIDTLLMALDINNIAASQGSACTSGTIKPSHAIIGIGKSVEDANGTLRFSFNPENTKHEVDYVVSILEKIANQNLR